MQQSQKQDIKKKLAEYCEKYNSQNKAANSLKGVSAGTISQILNDKWDSIADDMWQKISKQIGHSSKELVIVEITNYKFLTKLLKDAAENSAVYSVIDNPGASKSVASKAFTENNKRAYRIVCSEFWNKKIFLYELLSAIGGDASGLSLYEMVAEIVRMLKSQDSPVIILDEFEKVNDQVLYFFITLYNQLQDECGIVTVSTDHLEKRIKRGLRLNKKGYKEYYSRIGRRFVFMPGVNSTDVAQICVANGVTTKGEIKEIVEGCEYDLRRVKRMIHATRNVTQSAQ